MHLQKRRHRQKEQAGSRAKAIQKTEQGTRPQQKHTMSRGEDERKRAGNPLPPKSPVEETTHTTRAKHLTQHTSKIALCLLFTISISGNNDRIGIKQSYSREVAGRKQNRFRVLQKRRHTVQEELKRKTGAGECVRRKIWEAGEPKGEQRLARWRNEFRGPEM
jgi:hypothetical protein